MSRLLDPTICPDCRGRLDASARCTSCGLQLSGPLATQLWSLMVEADRLVEQLRLPAPAVPPAAPTLPADSLPAAPASVSVGGRSRRLPAASVPVVLLSLGAVCLLVAAVVFVAVTWSLLGLTGRTLVLVGLTAALSLAGALLTRRGLRGAAEAFWLIVAGMLVLDLLGAQSADLGGLGALSWRGTGALVGAALVALGLVVGGWARRQPVRRLYGVQASTVAGALVLCTTNAWLATHPALATTVAVPLLGAAFLLLRHPLPVAAYGMGGLAVVSWLVLLLIGSDRALQVSGFVDWWSSARGWPLLAAALLAAVVAQAPRRTGPLRGLAAGLALVPLTVLANAPATPGHPTRHLVVVGLSLAVLALLAATGGTAWAAGATGLTVPLALGLGLVLTTWSLDPEGGPVGSAAAPWTAAVLALALTAALTCLLRVVPERRRELARQSFVAVVPAVLALGALVVVLSSESPLWGGVLAADLAAAVAGAAAWWARRGRLAGWLGSGTTGYLALLALRTASADQLLLAVTVTALCLSLAAAHAALERTGPPLPASLTGALAALTGGWALLVWGVQLGADVDARATALAVYAAAVLLLAGLRTRRPAPRWSLEGSAALLGVVATAYSEDVRTSAMALTILGSAICLVDVVHRDRRSHGWVGAVVLGLATILRVAVEVPAPELYTLPAALLLCGAGLWRLRAEPETGTIAALGSGLALGVLPSLLLALQTPVSLRGALVGAAGVLLLAAGVRLRWTAPFVGGAVTTGLLALRHLMPVAEAVPRWLSLGAVGLALLLVGITWEARRRDLATAGRYLDALR